MNTNAQFNTAIWDEKYEVSTLHLSFLIQTLLPEHTIAWKATKRHFLSIRADIEDKLGKDGELLGIPTGSMAEGYSIPSSVCRDTSNSSAYNEILSDVDILCVMSKLKILTERTVGTTDDINAKGFFEYLPDSPGYVRICLLDPKNEDDIFIRDQQTGQYYLSGTKWTDKLFGSIKPLHDISRQGPAISLIDESMTAKLRLNDGISTDLVFALPCHPWPQVANRWISRASNSEWLTYDLIQSIVNEGCHVVAVPSKQSSSPDTEWRMSFSASEGRLAREAVTDYQRRCFIYLKIIHHQRIKPKGILSSYMFKSVFLHSCEILNMSYWRDYPGSCVLYMLDVMLDCLRNRHIPTYFLPENNLIRHCSSDDILEMITTVEQIRSDPVTPVLEFTDTRIFGRHSALIPFRKIVEPLINDMAAFKKHKDPAKSVSGGILSTGFNICLSFLREESKDTSTALFKYKEGVRHLINTFNFCLKMPESKMQNYTLTLFINNTGLNIKNQVRALRFFEAVVALSSDYPEFLSLRGNLACMYHGASYSKDMSEEKRNLYMTKAGELFEAVYEETGDSAVDYVAYLVKQDRYEDAIKILRTVISNNKKGVSRTGEISYDLKEADCLVEPLKGHVLEHGKISGDATSFAYFYLIYCTTRENSPDSTTELTEILKEFEEHCDKIDNKDSKTLLEYARYILKQECLIDG